MAQRGQDSVNVQKSRLHWKDLSSGDTGSHSSMGHLQQTIPELKGFLSVLPLWPLSSTLYTQISKSFE